ncbi:hypothetical protein BD779DRAFT_519365 [Infundibulicybe gibba]|nr:hypothetical protein BD779DRAFT_519365 [Infundibulicybe gibba]
MPPLRNIGFSIILCQRPDQGGMETILVRSLTSLLHIQKFPEARILYEWCKTIQKQLEPQLIKVSDSIITIVRVLGVQALAGYDLSVEETRWLISVPNFSNGKSDTFQKTLGLSNHDLVNRRGGTGLPPSCWVHSGLYSWLQTSHQLGKRPRPTCVAVDQYTWAWAWAWDTYDFQYGIYNAHSVHRVDLIYGCLRQLSSEFGQPLSSISLLARRTLEHVPKLLAEICINHVFDTPSARYKLNLLEVIEMIGFPSMLQALPDLTTTFCPKLFYLHRGLDELYRYLQPNGFADPPLEGPHGPIPHYQEFLETIYSRLLQDPLASRAVPVIYAMFAEPTRSSMEADRGVGRPTELDLPREGIEEFLGLVPGAFSHSTAMRGLFGVGFWKGTERLILSNSLGLLLKMGRVKLRPSRDNQNEHINDYMDDAHELLAFACVKHYASCKLQRCGTCQYGNAHWLCHLKHAKPSKRLFDTLGQMRTEPWDAKPVVQWLEKTPNVPENILARWRSARERDGQYSSVFLHYHYSNAWVGAIPAKLKHQPSQDETIVHSSGVSTHIWGMSIWDKVARYMFK